ncbi:GTP cyclohydrolase FolE2 [Priestia endophytica]|uniref:GTP cyclohydrolase FolE2 n=1 Tax=Priestia endophytica TaxID=135735 RepID=A0AAX1QA66_9BACI|nr:GTP cyclohydrolase FolE2 [Priestia endophytica]RAS75475.1 GTP cyclohydrolase I FolE2 [Priestia endophytica]
MNLPHKEERHRLFGSIAPGIKYKPTRKEEMMDLQNLSRDFLFPIKKVGISNVKIPVLLQSRLFPKHQTTIATFSLTSSLSHEQKGTNMSRFVEVLERYRQQGFTLNFSILHHFLEELAQELEQESTYLQVEFLWFYERISPSSNLTGLNHANITLDISYHEKKGFKDTVSMTCGITTLCPCSKEISEYSAHNQRGYVKMDVNISSNHVNDELNWKEDLLDAAESNASARLHPLLKRPDEKVVTEQAYENPRFVEDMVRLVGADLYEFNWIESFTVECRNEESIHLHDAFASISVKK